MHRTYLLIFTALCLLCASCGDKPTAPAVAALAYDLWIPGLADDSLHVRLTVTTWSGDSVHLALPPVYADNPMVRFSGDNVRNVRVMNSDGEEVGCARGSTLIGPDTSATVAFAAGEMPCYVEYDVRLSCIDTVYRNMPLPHIGPATGYLQGPYIFAVPFDSPELVRLWRTTRDISIEYHLGPGFRLLGDPLPSVKFRSTYELLFSTSAIIADDQVSARLLYEGTAGGQPFRFVSILPDTVASLSGGLVTRAMTDYTTVLADIVSVFGTISGPPLTAIVREPGGSGVEGMHAFSLLRPTEEDTIGGFNMVMSHETLHFWIGLRAGELDLPWWKEGTTNYLGWLFTMRNDVCSKEWARNSLLVNLDSIPDVQNNALNAPAVRLNLYAPGGGFGFLVYGKGGQVSMLMDRAIRDASAGATSLDKVLAGLVRTLDGRAFTRAEYVQFIRSASGADVAGIMAAYADQPGAIPDSVLRENYNALAARGAFGTGALIKAAPAGLGKSVAFPPNRSAASGSVWVNAVRKGN